MMKRFPQKSVTYSRFPCSVTDIFKAGHIKFVTFCPKFGCARVTCLDDLIRRFETELFARQVHN